MNALDPVAVGSVGAAVAVSAGRLVAYLRRDRLKVVRWRIGTYSPQAFTRTPYDDQATDVRAARADRV